MTTDTLSAPTPADTDNVSEAQRIAEAHALKSKVKAITSELLSFYDMQVDIDGLLDGMPLKDGEDANSFLERALNRLGFQYRKTKAKKLKLHNVDRPTLIKTPDDSYALTMPSRIYGSDRFVFGSSETDCQQMQSQPYSGEIFVIEQTEEKIGDYIAHMKSGHSLDWFWMPIFKYRRNYYEIVLASIFMNILVLAVPLYSLNIYDRVVINFIEETLYVLTIGVIIAIVFDCFFKNMRAYILERLAERLGKDFDFQLMERLMNLRVADGSISVGEQSNIFRELQTIREFYASKLVPTLIDLPFIAMFIGIIYMIGGAVAYVPIVTIVLIILLNLASHLPISKLMEQFFASTQNKSSFLIETLNGMDALRMFNAHSNRLFHWDRTVKRAARLSRHNSVLLGALSHLTFMLTQICHVMIVFVGAYLVNEGTLTIGGLITCSIISGRAIAPVMNFSSIIARLKQSEDVLKTVDKFFKMPHFDDENLQKAPKGPFKGALKVSDVTFNYPQQERPALQNVSLDIKAGAHIGIIGQSAAGKSTLAKVMGQLLSPEQGEVTLDGINIESIPHTELCRAITYAPQDSVFFRGSILHNITLGREDISEDAIREAITVSGLDIVLRQNGHGLDLPVGENGRNLSGGQKQALSLARALARRPQILIFDEPTNGMDNALEAHVQKQLKAYIKGRTFIMITHRTSLLSLVQELALIDKGRLVAHGPKKEIMDKLAGR